MIIRQSVFYVQIGTLVWVKNYRSKPKGKESPWEQGTVKSVRFENTTFSFGKDMSSERLRGPIYDVVLLRKNKEGFPLTLNVGNTDISLNEPENGSTSKAEN